MKGWQRSLLWEGLPFLMFFVILGSLAAINWGYESKMFTPDQTGSTFAEKYLGIILLAIAFAQVLLATAVLLVTRLVWPKILSSSLLLIPLSLVAILLIFPSLFMIVLGPAAITMIEQTRSAPR